MGNFAKGSYWGLLALLAIPLLLLSFACSKDKSDKDPEVAVQTAVAQRGPIKLTIKTEAILFPIRQAVITPKIAAPVKQFLVQRGTRVHKGQLLAVLENRDLTGAEVESKGSYEQAQAEYASATALTLPEEMQKAELDLQSAKQSLAAEEKLYASRESLFRQGALPRKELDQAGVALTQARNNFQIANQHLEALKAGVKQQRLQAAGGQLTAAKGKYETAAAMLSYSEIRSPIDGVVTDRPLYPGETPSSGAPLLTVMETAQVVARAHIPQTAAAQLTVGNAATISAPAIQNPLNGKVTLISPALDPNSTTVEVWVTAPNKDTQFRPGSAVQVAIVAENIPDATVIPAAALLTNPDGGTSVMIVGDDHRAHQQAVEVGVRNEGDVQITKGVKPNDKVVTAGAYGLPDNTKIREQPQPDRAEANGSADKGSK